MLWKKLQKFYYLISKQKPTPVFQVGRRNVIFIHINKTGGTSINDALNVPVKNHLTAREIIDEVGEEAYLKAYKFTVVRNPWSKVVSHYKYRVKTGQTGLKNNPLPFREWVKRTYGPEKDPALYHPPKMFQPQSDWLKDFSGEIKVDRLLKFERLSEDFEELAAELGIDKSLPHLNKTKKSDFRTYYDSETAEIIAGWFREDIERFGYEFQSG